MTMQEQKWQHHIVPCIYTGQVHGTKWSISTKLKALRTIEVPKLGEQKQNMVNLIISKAVSPSINILLVSIRQQYKHKFQSISHLAMVPMSFTIAMENILDVLFTYQYFQKRNLATVQNDMLEKLHDTTTKSIYFWNQTIATELNCNLT